MENLLVFLKANFAAHASITALVSTRCSFAIELQDSTLPFIAYNVRETGEGTYHGDEIQAGFGIVAKTPSSLFAIKDAIRTVLEQKFDATGYNFDYEGSSYPDTEQDDEIKLELTYNIINH